MKAGWYESALQIFYHRQFKLFQRHNIDINAEMELRVELFRSI